MIPGFHMTPSFSDYFKSCYAKKTYVPAVDLSDKGLAKHLMSHEDQATAAIAQRLISVPDVQQVLSEPLTYDMNEIPGKNAVLQGHGFRLLSSKPNLESGDTIPFYTVIEHDELKGWIIKSGATRVPKDQLMIGPMNDLNEMAFFTEEESLLRIEMAQRVQRAAQEAKIDVVVPKKKLVAYANVDDVKEPTRKYCVLCEKVDILSSEDTVNAIKKMDEARQREVAKQISTLIEKTGFVDTSFENIRLTPDGKLAFIDTEPAGLMAAKKPGLRNKLFEPKGSSVEKCARIGLYNLMLNTGVMRIGLFGGLEPKDGLEGFHKEVRYHYHKASSPQLSKRKIGLSIASLGILPLINAIIALVKTELCKRKFNQLMNIDNSIREQVEALKLKPEAEQARVEKEYQEKRTPLAKKYFAYTEGVPYKSGFPF